VGQCVRCKRSGDGEVGHYFIGRPMSAKTTHSTGVLQAKTTTVTSYRMEGSGQGFVCSRCVARYRTSRALAGVILGSSVVAFASWLAAHKPFGGVALAIGGLGAIVLLLSSIQRADEIRDAIAGEIGRPSGTKAFSRSDAKRLR
jgi:hypothetical protein